eukprot:403352110
MESLRSNNLPQSCLLCNVIFGNKLMLKIVIPCMHAYCLKCLSPQDCSFYCISCKKDVALNQQFRNSIENLLQEHQKMTLICRLHHNQNAQYYCKQCDTYACRQCTQEQHREHQGQLKPVGYEIIQRKIESTRLLAQRQIKNLQEQLKRVLLFEINGEEVDINDFQSAIYSIVNQKNLEQPEEEIKEQLPNRILNAPVQAHNNMFSVQESREEQKSQRPHFLPQNRANNFLNSQLDNPNQGLQPQFQQNQIREQQQIVNFQLNSQINNNHAQQQVNAQSNQQQVQERNLTNVQERAEINFDAFGHKSMISENQKIKNLIRNNRVVPESEDNFRVKFSFLCFQYLDDILLISVKLEALKDKYSYIFRGFEIVEKYCHIYINANMMGWENVLNEIESYLPVMKIFPMRDIKRGYEQFLIKAFIENRCQFWNDRQIRINFISISDSRISKYLYSEDSLYSEENEPQFIANKGTMVIFIPKRDQNELHMIEQLIIRFIQNAYQNLYDLFELCEERDFAKRSHIAVFLKNTEIIDDSLSSRGYQDKQVDYRTHKQKIYVRATQNEYDNFVQDVTQAIRSVQTKTLSLKLRIHFMKTYLGNNLSLQQKLQNQFNVFVSETFRVVTKMDEITNKERQICEYITIPDSIAMLIYQEHQYKIQVTGIMIGEAVKYIMSIPSHFSFKERKLTQMSQHQKNQLIQNINEIKVHYPVVVQLDKGILYIYGENLNGKFDEFYKKVLDLIPKNQKRN